MHTVSLPKSLPNYASLNVFTVMFHPALRTLNFFYSHSVRSIDIDTSLSSLTNRAGPPSPPYIIAPTHLQSFIIPFIIPLITPNSFHICYLTFPHLSFSINSWTACHSTVTIQTQVILLFQLPYHIFVNQVPLIRSTMLHFPAKSCLYPVALCIIFIDTNIRFNSHLKSVVLLILALTAFGIV